MYTTFAEVLVSGVLAMSLHDFSVLRPGAFSLPTFGGASNKINSDIAGTPDGLPLVGGVFVPVKFRGHARVTLPKNGGGRVVMSLPQKNSAAGGVRFRADAALHRLASGTWVSLDTGEVVRLAVGDVLPAVDEYQPIGDDRVWADDDGVVLARSYALSNAKRSRRRMLEYAFHNDWMYFITMTFDARKLEQRGIKSRFDVIIIQRVREWLNNRRRVYGPAFKYLMVPELHKNGAIHLHMLVMGLPESQLVPALYSDGRRRVDASGRVQNRWVDASAVWGFTDGSAVDSVESVSKYVSKYISKSLDAAHAWDAATTGRAAAAAGQGLPGVAVSGLGYRHFYVSQGLESAPVFAGDGVEVELDDSWFVVNSDGSAGMGPSTAPGVFPVVAVRDCSISDDWLCSILDDLLESKNNENFPLYSVPYSTARQQTIFLC